MNNKTILVFILLIVAVSSRLIPHYPNFTALGATALLSGALLKNKMQSFILPLVALFLSDVLLNNLVYPADGFVLFYAGAAYTYIAIALITVIGLAIKNLKPKNYVLASVLATVVFFLLTNYGVWKTGFLYSTSNVGLIQSYAAAIPFAINDLAANLVFGVVILATYKLAIGEKSLAFSRV